MVTWLHVKTNTLYLLNGTIIIGATPKTWRNKKDPNLSCPKSKQI